MTGDRRHSRRAGFSIVAVVVVAAVLGACSGSVGPGATSSFMPSGTPGATPGTTPASSPLPSGVAGLAGRTFVSTGVTDGGAPFALVPGTRIRLTFEAANLGASAGCNLIGGEYRVDDGRLVFTGAVMTEMACQDGRDAQDQWLVSILGAHPSISLAGDVLALQAGRVTITLLDREVAEPDQPLAGPQWVVVGIISGDSVSSVPAGIFATLWFEASGQVAVNTGCNEGSGHWVVRDDTLVITDLGLTKKACEPPIGEFESAILGVLRADTLTFEIDAASLTLSAADSGLQLQALGPD